MSGGQFPGSAALHQQQGEDSWLVTIVTSDLRYDEQGERRIRVHTLCVPTTASLQEVIQSADQQCIVGLLAKMAVDRTLNTNLADAREAFINVCVDTIERWPERSLQLVLFP